MGASPADLNTSEFNESLQLLSMQKKSRLRDFVRVGTHEGKQAVAVNQIAATAMSTRTARNQPKVLTNIANERRWVQPTGYFTHTTVDPFDELRTNVSVNSDYMRSQMAAMNLTMDERIIEATVGDAKTGEEAGTTVNFADDGGRSTSAAQISAAVLLDGLSLLKEGEVNMDDPEEAIVCVITPDQERVLLQDDKLISADYVTQKLLSEAGRLMWWRGINFVISNYLVGSVDGVVATEDPGANASRSCPMFAKSGMHLGLWDDVRGKIVQRTDLTDDPTEMSVYATIGATRLEGVKVVEILVNETA